LKQNQDSYVLKNLEKQTKQIKSAERKNKQTKQEKYKTASI